MNNPWIEWNSPAVEGDALPRDGDMTTIDFDTSDIPAETDMYCRPGLRNPKCLCARCAREDSAGDPCCCEGEHWYQEECPMVECPDFEERAGR